MRAAIVAAVTPEPTRRPGTLRRRDPLDPSAWIEAGPGEPLYSSLCLFADEWWTGQDWQPYADMPEPG